MRLDFNFRVIICLFLLSLLTLVAHRLGVLDIELSLTDPSQVLDVGAIAEGNTVGTFSSENETLSNHCFVKESATYRLCGISIVLGQEGTENGIDLRLYDRLELKVRYQSDSPEPKVRVTFRNFDPIYSNSDDYVSLKFNTITLEPNIYDDSIVVPLNAFQVENWWIEQFKVGFANSHLDFSNVSLVEIVNDGQPSLGDHTITLHTATLYGQLVSEIELLKIILVVWLTGAVWLVARQRNKLKVISSTDTLTGLNNRRGISHWVSSRLALQLHSTPLSMFYFDLDDFKKVNDSYGHRVGDELLCGFCQRISQYLETNYANYKYAFARLSGDEFTLVFKSLTEQHVNGLAKDLLRCLVQPICLSGHDISVNVSLGVAQSDADTHTFEDLMAKADSAMYFAKKRGKNQFKIFDESVSEEIFYRKQVAEKIRQALNNDEFHLNFMPIFDSQTLRTQCCEVLLRCHAESLKGIGPDVFIPIAEEFNLIEDIDMWVIESTFALMQKHAAFLQDNPIHFCLNISAAELHNTQFPKHVRRLLKKYAVMSQWIEFEITETSLIETDERCIVILHEIRELGIKLALDDFGTGYTAFSQLINYPVDCLKIDKSFVDDISANKDTQGTMVRAIISIAKSYRMTTIAEGIESLEQYQYLQQHQCDLMQGYWYSKPLLWKNFQDLINQPLADKFKKLIK